MTREEKQENLDKLEGKMKKADLPLKEGANKLVFGVGDPDADILLIGEGPGYWEDQKGEPFVGRAGKFLDYLLESIDLERKDVYITNVVHYRPPNNRDPEPDELKAFGKYLDKIIEIIDPKVIVTLGRFSMRKFLPSAMISGVHGKINKMQWRGKDVVVIPMYHPAAGLRNGEIKRKTVEDFKAVTTAIEELNKEIEDEEKGVEQMSLI